jgi:hypothetical protein
MAAKPVVVQIGCGGIAAFDWDFLAGGSLKPSFYGSSGTCIPGARRWWICAKVRPAISSPSGEGLPGRLLVRIPMLVPFATKVTEPDPTLISESTRIPELLGFAGLEGAVVSFLQLMARILRSEQATISFFMFLGFR